MSDLMLIGLGMVIGSVAGMVAGYAIGVWYGTEESKSAEWVAAQK